MFWSLTIRELFQEFAAYVDAQHAARDRDLTVAWYTAAFSRAEKLPPLTSILTKRSGRQTPAEQRRALQMIFPGKGRPRVH